MFRLFFLILVCSLAVACSDDQGELVEKVESTPSSQNQSVAQGSGGGSGSGSGSELPPGHPPMDGSMQNPASVMEPGPPQEAPAIEGDQATVAGLAFQIDPAWQSEQPSSSFRAAQFNLPAPEGHEDHAGEAELALFQGIGGSAQQNIERWIGQFNIGDRDPSEVIKTTQTEINGLQVSILDISGSYNSDGGMMGGGESVEGQRMIAAVVEGPGGPWHWKLVGPQETVTHWKESFDSLIASMRTQ